MYEQNEVNISISGWPGSGNTTTALILAYLLQKKFIYAGGVFKFIADKLGYSPISPRFHEYENKYGEEWDILWEKYVVWKLENEQNLVANTKVSGFFSDAQEKLFEVFIIANTRIRTMRSRQDNRTEEIVKRDELLSKRWRKLFNIELMNLEDIKKSHDLVIDSSNMGIADVVFKIYKTSKEVFGFPEKILRSELDIFEKTAHEKGKNFFYDKLKEQNLLITHKEIFQDWLNFFYKDLQKTKPEWRNVVEKNS